MGRKIKDYEETVYKMNILWNEIFDLREHDKEVDELLEKLLYIKEKFQAKSKKLEKIRNRRKMKENR